MYKMNVQAFYVMRVRLVILCNVETVRYSLELVAQLTIRGIFPLHPLLQHLEGMLLMRALLPLLHLLHLTASQGEGGGQGWQPQQQTAPETAGLA